MDNLQSFKDEISWFYKVIWIVVAFLVIILWGWIFAMSYYKWILDEQNQEIKNKNNVLTTNITEHQERIENFLQWKWLEDFKKTEEALTNYFITRLTEIPKALIVEFLEEITPPEIKYNWSISITKWLNLNMNFFAIDIEQIWEYYYKLRYYEELWLIKIETFNTVKLQKPEQEQLKKYWLPLNVKYIYATNISFIINTEKLKEYYFIMLWEPKYYSEIKDYILVKNPIEPLSIPDNIWINDVGEIHKTLRERIEKELEAMKNNIEEVDASEYEETEETNEKKETEKKDNWGKLKDTIKSE